MLVSGENPINAFQALLAGALGSKTAIATTLGKTVPLLFVGMACAFSNKAGLFNIGCEGQLYIGALTATATALAMQGLPRFLVILVSFLTGMMSGALVGGFNGLLKAKLNINEVLVAIMLNYIMKFFASYCVHGPMKDPKSKVMQSPSIGQEYMLTNPAKISADYSIDSGIDPGSTVICIYQQNKSRFCTSCSWRKWFCGTGSRNQYG